MQYTKTKGHIMALTCTILWGSTFILNKYLISLGFEPIQIIVTREILAVITLLIFTHSMPPIDFKRDKYLLLTGFIGVFLYVMLDNTSLKYTYATNASLIISSAPILVTLFSRICKTKEKLTAATIIGIILSFIGAFLVIFNGNFFLKLNPLGDMLAVGAAVSWAAYSILLIKCNEVNAESANPLTDMELMCRIFSFGLAITLLFSPLFSFHFPVEMITNPKSLIIIVLLAVLPAALCAVIWNKTIMVIGSIKANIYLYLMPVVSIVMAGIFLHEKLTFISATGSLLILLGLFIAQDLLGSKKHQQLAADNK